MNKKQLIIIGGGSSIIEGIDKGLFGKLKNKFTFGLNYSHHFVDTTTTLYVDDKFYYNEKLYLNALPMVIGQKFPEIPSSLHHITLPIAIKYNRDCKGGVYKPTLVGLFALSLGIHILDIGEIFILGYDSGAKNKTFDQKGRALTHFYQYGNLVSKYTDKPVTLDHRGISKINWYNGTRIDKVSKKRITRAEHEFKVYAQETRVKIYNVSLESKIPTFEKISYNQFFKMLDNQVYDQNELRKEIKQKLNF